MSSDAIFPPCDQCSCYDINHRVISIFELESVEIRFCSHCYAQLTKEKKLRKQFFGEYTHNADVELINQIRHVRRKRASDAMQLYESSLQNSGASEIKKNKVAEEVQEALRETNVIPDLASIVAEYSPSMWLVIYNPLNYRGYQHAIFSCHEKAEEFICDELSKAIEHHLPSERALYCIPLQYLQKKENNNYYSLRPEVKEQPMLLKRFALDIASDNVYYNMGYLFSYRLEEHRYRDSKVKFTSKRRYVRVLDEFDPIDRISRRVQQYPSQENALAYEPDQPSVLEYFSKKKQKSQ